MTVGVSDVTTGLPTPTLSPSRPTLGWFLELARRRDRRWALPGGGVDAVGCHVGGGFWGARGGHTRGQQPDRFATARSIDLFEILSVGQEVTDRAVLAGCPVTKGGSDGVNKKKTIGW